MKLNNDAARIFFVWIVSLLPGTVSTHMRDGVLLVHVLDRHNGAQEKLRLLERHVAGLFASKNR